MNSSPAPLHLCPPARRSATVPTELCRTLTTTARAPPLASEESPSGTDLREGVGDGLEATDTPERDRAAHDSRGADAPPLSAPLEDLKHLLEPTGTRITEASKGLAGRVLTTPTTEYVEQFRALSSGIHVRGAVPRPDVAFAHAGEPTLPHGYPRGEVLANRERRELGLADFSDPKRTPVPASPDPEARGDGVAADGCPGDGGSSGAGDTVADLSAGSDSGAGADDGPAVGAAPADPECVPDGSTPSSTAHAPVNLDGVPVAPPAGAPAEHGPEACGPPAADSADRTGVDRARERGDDGFPVAPPAGAPAEHGLQAREPPGVARARERGDDGFPVAPPAGAPAEHGLEAREPPGVARARERGDDGFPVAPPAGAPAEHEPEARQPVAADSARERGDDGGPVDPRSPLHSDEDWTTRQRLDSGFMSAADVHRESSALARALGPAVDSSASLEERPSPSPAVPADEVGRLLREHSSQVSVRARGDAPSSSAPLEVAAPNPGAARDASSSVEVRPESDPGVSADAVRRLVLDTVSPGPVCDRENSAASRLEADRKAFHDEWIRSGDREIQADLGQPQTGLPRPPPQVLSEYARVFGDGATDTRCGSERDAGVEAPTGRSGGGIEHGSAAPGAQVSGAGDGSPAQLLPAPELVSPAPAPPPSAAELRAVLDELYAGACAPLTTRQRARERTSQDPSSATDGAARWPRFRGHQ